MNEEITDPERPPPTRYRGPRFWWITSALSVSGSTSFVITQLLPVPDSMLLIRWFVLALFAVGLLTGIFSAMILMMSGFLFAGTATVRGREVASSEMACCFLGCYLVPVIAVAWSVFRGQGVA